MVNFYLLVTRFLMQVTEQYLPFEVAGSSPGTALSNPSLN